MEKILPNVPRRVYQSLLALPGGKYAQGVYNGIINVSDIASKGTAYHEAFHAVSDLYLSDGERNSLYDDVRSKLGSNTTDKEAEEYLADEFKVYMVSNKQYSVPKLFKPLFNWQAKNTNWQAAQ